MDFNKDTGGGSFNPVIGNQLLIMKKGSITSASKDESHIIAMTCQTINEDMVQPIGCNATFDSLGPDVK